MNKTELVEQIAQKADLSRKDAESAVEAALKTIEEQLARGGEITLTGFGKFHVAERGPRQGVNPQTKERITIPGGRVPRFTAGSALKGAVKSG